MPEQEIYFHVGLGKVASTYLQHEFFPKLQSIDYIPTNRYRKSKKILAQMGSGKYLVSREFDRQFEREVTSFCAEYPDTKIIIIFRRHGSWIASQYRRYAKNGFHWGFDRFMDFEKDEGHWKQKDLLFYPKLEIIERCSTQKPLILFHDDLKKNSWAFLQSIADYTGSTFNKEQISLNPVHTSYTEKQLKVLQAFCRRFKPTLPRSYHNKVLHWLLYRPWWGLFHLVMYAAVLVPERWISKAPLISKEQLEAVDKYYEEDWDRVKNYPEQLTNR